jgi:hypothetical protein
VSRDLVELFTLHLLGALDGDEAREASALAASADPAARDALARAERFVHAIAHGAPPVAPPAQARAHLLARAAAEPVARAAAGPDAGTPSPSSRSAPVAGRRPATRWGVAALAISFLALAALQVVTVLSRGGRDDRERVVGALADPRNPRWTLASTGSDRAPMATAVLDEERRWILVRGPALPRLETGQVYVLWGVPRGGGAPRNLAAFRGGNPGLDAVVEDAPRTRELAELAVSVERDPRVAAPTRVVASGGGP